MAEARGGVAGAAETPSRSGSWEVDGTSGASDSFLPGFTWARLCLPGGCRR